MISIIIYLCIYIYIYVYRCVYVYIYIYIYLCICTHTCTQLIRHINDTISRSAGTCTSSRPSSASPSTTSRTSRYNIIRLHIPA